MKEQETWGLKSIENNLRQLETELIELEIDLTRPAPNRTYETIGAIMPWVMYITGAALAARLLWLA